FASAANCHGQIRHMVDVAPSGRQNYLAVEGGGILMRIDSITPLDSLIARLSEPWHLIETGKAYWIGYNNDMFSIAARAADAIQPLLNVLKRPSPDGEKEGALLCLHLIGIDRRIAGRFSENFVNPKARNALLDALRDTSIQVYVMRLLERDPWQSDIP